jgi:hypothetical protein
MTEIKQSQRRNRMPPAAGWSKKRFPVAFFTTCDWADKFCDGEIWEQFAGWSPRRISAPDTTAKHYWKRLKEMSAMSTQDLVAGSNGQLSPLLALSERRYPVGKST